MARSSEPAPTLERVVGVPGAVLLGLGSILGTGVFVSIGIAAGVVGTGVVWAVALAAVVALCNGLSSAQLAASHPVSGGTYEYGYRYLHPALGFTAGWMFLCAKSASAATAALGVATYSLAAFGIGHRAALIGVAAAVVAVCTALVAGGLRRSNRANAVLVSLTVLGLLAFVAAGLPTAASSLPDLAVWPEGPPLLEATALVFVAYTGYGRIATLGEEVRDPARSIPRAIVTTLVLTMLLYGAVAVVAVSVIAPESLDPGDDGAAPLERAAAALSAPALVWIVRVSAVVAMVGVLLNLLLGLSRVLLAMGRRRDMPGRFAELDARTRSPRNAVLAVGAIILGLSAIGRVEVTWSFSAFTVLIYYALTNLAALRLPAAARRFPRWVALVGLVGCLGLAFWVDPVVWAVGLGVLAVGWIWFAVARNRRARS